MKPVKYDPDIQHVTSVFILLKKGEINGTDKNYLGTSTLIHSYITLGTQEYIV